MAAPFRLGLFQFAPETGRPSANLEAVLEGIDRLPQPIDLAILPENWPAGYGSRALATEVAPQAEAILAALGERARRGSFWMAGSLPYPSAEADKCFNRAFLIGPDGGVWAHYDKSHLFALMREETIMVPGDRRVVVDTPWGRMGLAVCFDLRFPEFIRAMALDGMQLLVLPSQWPHPRRDHFQTLLRARAIENQCFVAACNRNGMAGGLRFFGASSVIDPWGEVLLEMAEEQTGWGFAAIDRDRIAEVRRTLPVLPLRRPELYRDR